MFKAFVFLGLVAIAVTRETSPYCETKVNILPDDWLTFNADISKPSEKILCLFKCIYEETGNVNSDGAINVEKFVENVHKRKPLTEDSKTAIKECLEKLGAVKTCADVSPSYQCVQRTLEKQKRGAA